MSDFTEKNFSIGEVNFVVDKMGALKGWKVLEKCRKAMASTEVAPSKGQSAQALGMFKALMGLDPEFVEWLRTEMFNTVRFQAKSPDGHAQPWLPLSNAGNVDMCFESLEPVHIYEVMARAFAVNFTGSWQELLSRFTVLQALVGNLSRQSTSTPSSPDQSKPDSADTKDFKPYP